MEIQQIKRKGKKNIIYVRVDNVLINELFWLREKFGISTSELVRESIRRLLEDCKLEGTINLSI